MNLDLGSIEQTDILLASGATIAASTLLTLLMQATKDWFPHLRGRAAVGAIYGASFLTALVLVAQLGADPRKGITWLTIAIFGLQLTATARGIFHSMRRDSGGEG